MRTRSPARAGARRPSESHLSGPSRRRSLRATSDTSASPTRATWAESRKEPSLTLGVAVPPNPVSTPTDRPSSAEEPVGASGAEQSVEQPVERVDLLVIGAGLSGIGAGHQFAEAFPGKTFAILESRDRLGGTWDLFRYPGIRSDSDMHTLGYRWRPWTKAKSIADGPSILAYLQETAGENGALEPTRFGHRVQRAEWSSAEARGTVHVERTVEGRTETVRFSCRFLFSGAGYYRYDEGYTPHFEGRERFRGRIIHPQHWPEDLDYAGKRVVVIGSGATAVTLVPALAEQAAHVVMLQRSPTYIASLPARDPIAAKLRQRLSPERTFSIVRWKNVLL